MTAADINITLTFDLDYDQTFDIDPHFGIDPDQDLDPNFYFKLVCDLGPDFDFNLGFYLDLDFWPWHRSIKMIYCVIKLWVYSYCRNDEFLRNAK